MSEHHTNKRPLDPSLSADLAACESGLTGMSLPASGIDRDTLLYRAGWAAAEAHAERSRERLTPRPASGAAGRRAPLAWCLASALVATSVTVAVVQVWQPSTDRSTQKVADVVRDDQPAAEPESMRQPAASAPLPAKRTARVPIGWTASLLTMRDRALLQQLDDPWVKLESRTTASSVEDTVASPPKSSREMLREFLPLPATQTPNNLRSSWRPTG